MTSDDVVKRIDAELTFYSAGLGREVTVEVERALAPPEQMFEEWLVQAHQAYARMFENAAVAFRQFADGLSQLLAPIHAAINAAAKVASPPTRWACKTRRRGKRWTVTRVGRSSS